MTVIKSLDKQTVCLIPARKGSKGIPGKNKRLVGGKPLVSYSLEFAGKICEKSHIYVSSDDEDVLRIAENFGANCIRRPDELASDFTPMIEVLKHAHRTAFPAAKRIVLLQPTSPIRSEAELLAAIDLLQARNAEIIASISKVPVEYSPELMSSLRDVYLVPVIASSAPTRRQDTADYFIRNGQFYVISAVALSDNKGLMERDVIGFETGDRGVNLDTLDDWNELLKRFE